MTPHISTEAKEPDESLAEDYYSLILDKVIKGR